MKLMDHDYPLAHWQRIAEQNGIQRRTFQYRLQQYSPRAAATMPIKGKGRDGRSTSPRQIALKAGLHERAVTDYRQRHPTTELSNEQIANQLAKRKADIDKGNSVHAQARAAGVGYATVRLRLKRGLPLEQALNPQRMTKQEAGQLGGKAHRRTKQKPLKNELTN